MRGGSTAIVGTSSRHGAVRASWSESAPACSLVRGTSTRQPNSGLVSNQDRRAALRDGVTDHDNAGPRLLGSLDRGGELAQRCRDGALLDRRDGAGDDGRGGGRAARVQQQPGHVGGAVGRAEHHRVTRESVWAAQSTAGSSMSTTRTSRALPPTSPAPAYAARPLSSETPGATSNGTRAFATAVASIATEPSYDRVAGEQAHDAVPGLGGLDDELGPPGVRQRRPRRRAP